MGIKSKLTISLSLIILLYGGYYFGVPAILNRPANTEFLKSYVEKEYGYKTEIKNPVIKMGFLPAVWIKSNEFNILNNDSTKALSVKNVNAKIKLIPLLLGKAEISHFSADNLNVNLIFDKNSRLNLGQYPFVNVSQSRIIVEKAEVTVNKYKIKLYDEIKNKNILLDGKEFTLYDFKDSKRIKFATDAKLAVGEKTSHILADVDLKLPLSRVSEDQVQITGVVTDLNLADFSTYAQSLSNKTIKKLSGIVNIDIKTSLTPDNHKKIDADIRIDNLGIYKEDLAASIYCKDKIRLNTEISLIRNGIKIDDLQLKTKGIDAFMHGKIKRLNAKTPNLDLTAGIRPSRIENIIPLLPGDEKISDDVNLYLLKKYGYFGDITGSLEIKGNPQEPSIYGNILSENGYLIKPIPNNTPKATVKIKFDGAKSDLLAIVPTSHTQTVIVSGVTNLYGGKETDLRIRTTKSVDLKTAQTVLNPLHEVLKFDLGPVPVMDLRGKGSVNLHILGSKVNPHAWGEFSFTDTTASFNDIHNLTLEQGEGKLTFEDQNTHFITNKAFLNNKPFTIDGTCTLLGVLDFKVFGKNQKTEDLLKIIQSSPMLKDIQEIADPLKKAEGKANLEINLTGQVRNVYDIVFNKNIFAKGRLELDSNNIEIKDFPIPLKNLSGIINFNNFNANYSLVSSLNKSRIYAEGKVKDLIVSTKIVSDSFNLADGLMFISEDNKKIPFAKDLATIHTSFTANYKGPMDKIDYDNISFRGKIYSNKGARSNILIENGSYELAKSNFKLYPLRGTFKKNPYIISADISKLFSNNRDINGSFVMKNFDLSLLDDLKTLDIFPKEFNSDDIKELSGIINVDAKIRHNNLNLFTKLDDTSFVYVPKKMKININSGNLLLRNDVLSLNKVNAHMGEMPLFIDGKITDIYKTPDMNLYVNAKPTQEFFDQFFNNKAVYPIKLKGDVICSSKILGTKDQIESKTELKIEENSSIYYMGASLGDVNNTVKIYLDSAYTPRWIRINNFKYDKIIASQNNKNFANTQLLASGAMEFMQDNNVKFHNFRIKTQNPTDAKIFNVIFRKPLMKQGVFTSDLIINGTAFTPKILGTLDVTSVDMPFLDATIKDVNLDFKNDKIFINSKGVVLTNSINLIAVMKNNLIFPYMLEDVKLKLKDLDINKITDSIRDYQTDLYRNKNTQASIENLDLSQLVIKKAEIEADTVKVKNISAENFKAELSLDNKMVLDVKKYQFNIAQGHVNGSLKYDLLTNRANLLMHMKDANAQMISQALFDLQNQIFGSLTGDITLNCNAKNHETCTKTLSGDGYFIVANGKMPKLGSLEYLLKAGNLLKGGFTGISINSLIDLIIPLKTGEFDSISGNLHVANGIVQNINVYSNGKDLNMYMKGSYNISNSIADMNVYGSLSNNMTSVLGRIKNVSLNTLLNTIPLVNRTELNPMIIAEINKIPSIDTHNIYRIFTAEIFGDINGNNYVRSFKWVK